MLRFIVIVLAVIVFAKPIYDVVTVEEQKETHEVAEIQGENVELEPKPINRSLDDLVETFYVYSSRFEQNFVMNFVGSTNGLEGLLEQISEELEKKDPYIYGHLSKREIVYEYSKIKAEIKVEQSYSTNVEQEQQVDALVAQLVSSVPQTMTTYDKVKFVNDYIVKNTVYSESSKASPHSAYAVAIEGKGVCQGYALFAYKLLRALGVENHYVTGEVETGGHAWNLVKVDGAWYHLDTTWNDPLPDRGQEVRYDYFLISDAQIGQDHMWEQGKFPQAVNSY
ncbi:MAG: transglutaminase domain-containing protein [Solibacillus sp.]